MVEMPTKGQDPHPAPSPRVLNNRDHHNDPQTHPKPSRSPDAQAERQYPCHSQTGVQPNAHTHPLIEAQICLIATFNMAPQNRLSKLCTGFLTKTRRLKTGQTNCTTMVFRLGKELLTIRDWIEPSLASAAYVLPSVQGLWPSKQPGHISSRSSV